MTDFAVNRRNNREPDVPELEKRHALRGPSDHSVPVMAVRGLDGKLLAVVFAYACHNTTLDIQQWSGDYAGFAETNLETAYPGAVALFCMGCGGDQNPIPRRTVELCRHYGRMMSDAVAAVLERQLEPRSRRRYAPEYESVTLELGVAPTRDELKSLAKNGAGSYIKRWAARLLREKDAERPLAQSILSRRDLATGGQAVVDRVGGRSRRRL